MSQSVNFLGRRDIEGRDWMCRGLRRERLGDPLGGYVVDVIMMCPGSRFQSMD